MTFLKESDYSVQIRSEVKAVIARDAASQALAEQMAQEEMSGYLRTGGYDVAAIFSALDTARNAVIIMRMVDMTIYHLHAAVVVKAMPVNRETRYTAALAWLDKVSAGTLDLDLPKVVAANTAQ